MNWDEFEASLEPDQHTIFEKILAQLRLSKSHDTVEKEVAIHRQRRERTYKRFQTIIDDLRVLQDRLLEDVAPTKNSEKPLPDDTEILYEQLVQEIDVIELFNRITTERYLRQSEIDELSEINGILLEYYDYIPDRQKREEAAAKFEAEIGTLRAVRDVLEEDVVPAMEANEPLPKRAIDIRERIQESVRTISSLREGTTGSYLNRSERETLDEIETACEEYVEFVPTSQQRDEAERRFEEEIEDLRRLYNRLEEDVIPVRESGGRLSEDAEEIYDQLESACDTIEDLKSSFDTQRFTREEMNELRVKEETFKRCRYFIPKKLREQRREKVRGRFKKSIGRLRSIEKSIDKEVDAVKNSGKKLPENTTKIESKIQSGLDVLSQLEAEIDKRYLRKEDKTELRTIKSTLEESQSYVRGRKNARILFQESIDQLYPIRDQLFSEIKPVKTHGKPLPDNAGSIENRLQKGFVVISDLKSESDSQYLHPHETSKIDDIREVFSEYREYIPEKRKFDEKIASVEDQYRALESNSNPFLEYEQYLTDHRREKLKRSLEGLEQNLDHLHSTIDLEKLGKSDRKRVSKISSRHRTIDDHLKGYNSEFVRRQLVACEDLFTDIDDAGNDLNEAQRKAVIRNNTYNQVIAAAGTGKTLALVYRVVYLIREQGIHPNRILALTYTKKAKEEMRDRLAEQFGITDVDIRTLHSFAYKIAQEASNTHLTTVQSRDVYNLIEDVIREETSIETSEFHDHYVQYLYHSEHEDVNEPDFEAKTDHIARRAEETYQTMAGETVGSRAEKVIADFLFVHKVDYQYEAIAEWANGSDEKNAYRPDFFLPDYDIHIEHWGLDETGEVAPWFTWTSAEYRKKLVWARDQFEKSDLDLVETYEFEHQRSPTHLKRVLHHRLEHYDVTLERVSFRELIDSAYEYHEIEEKIKADFKQFIEFAKTFDIAADEIRSRLDENKPRQYHFGRCGEIVLRRYADYLERNDLVDYEDMIYRAIAAIDRSPISYQTAYDHLLVDEFQDVSMNQMELLQGLCGSTGPRLFTVGDDWQSIYSFQGSDVQYFVDFEEHFGPAAKTYFTANYRCPRTILDAGNDLIENNDSQLEKTVTARSERDTTPTLHTIEGYTDSAYARRVGEYTAHLVEEYIRDGSDPSEIMVLCRYDDGGPYLDEVKRHLRRQEIPFIGKDSSYHLSERVRRSGSASDTGVSVFAVHRAKGREADHVILVHAAEGRLGFPASKRDNELLEPVREVETNTISEERRLFYVGITRAKKTLDIQTQKSLQSPFVEEIETYLEKKPSVAAPGKTGNRASFTAKVHRLFDNLHPTQQQAGVLADRTGTVLFVSWVNENPPRLKEGVWYRFENVEVSEYKEEMQIIVKNDTEAIDLFQEVLEPSE